MGRRCEGRLVASQISLGYHVALSMASQSLNTYHLMQPAGAAPMPSYPVPEPMRCKRRIQLSYMVPQQQQQPQPTAVAKRNERERKRVRMVNMGFTSLRQHVPNGAKNKKLSKVETLRSAIEYIAQLQQLLTGYDFPTDAGCSASPQTTNSDENSCPASEHVVPGYGYGAYGATVNPMAGRPDCATVSSPSPSLGSDGQSPTETLSSSDEDILSFSSWFT